MADSLLDEISGTLDKAEQKRKGKTIRAKKEPKAKAVKKVTKKEQQIIDLSNNTVMPDYYYTVWTEGELEDLCAWLRTQEEIAVDTETMGLNTFKDEIVGLSIYAPHKGFYIPLSHKDNIGLDDFIEPGKKIGIDYVKCLPKYLVSNMLKPIFEDKSKKFILHNAKFDVHILRNWLGIEITPYFDTMIAQAVLDETQSKALKDIAPYYLHISADKFSTLFGKITFDRVPIKLNPNTRTGNLASYYAIKDTELTYRMYKYQDSYLQKDYLKEIHDLFYNIEMPFLMVVCEAEKHGVKLDEEYLQKTVAKKLHEEVEELRQKIWAYTGEINLNSPAQVSYSFYQVLNLPQVNQEKPNSTDKKTLKKIKSAHPVIPLYMDYKEKVKLVTAFADKLPKAMVEGRIHTSFNTVGTKTGRMSSSTPNLQQIPARIGGLIRNAFIADEGRLLVSIDFSQQELRVLAHVSKDPVLMDIYKNGKDVHSMTAVGMWNRMHEENVSYTDFEYRRKMAEHFQDRDGNFVDEKFHDEEHVRKLYEEGKVRDLDPDKLREDAELGVKYEKTRKQAKTVNFGIIYGMGSKGLADQLEITEEEAEVYIQGYFDAYPGVKKWMAEQKDSILKNMFSKTMLGRKRRVYPEIKSNKFWMIQRGIRMAINAIIQGSSADMVKLASIKLQKLLNELNVKIVMWVHDEIIFDAPTDIGMENLQKLADVMCNALPLDCGLKSDIEAGERWGQRMSTDELEALRVMRIEIEEEEKGESDDEECLEDDVA